MRAAPVVGATALALFLGGCASGAAVPAQQTPETSSADRAAMAVAEGEQIFRDVCAQCHTMDPPPNLAPPMRMVSRHLRQSFGEESDAVAHVVSYVRQPAADASIMPAHAIERFGLMPPQPLPEEMLEKVARYVWTLSADLPEESMGPGLRMRRGPGWRAGG